MTIECMRFRDLMLDVEVGEKLGDGHYEMTIVGAHRLPFCFIRESEFGWEARCRKCSEIVECNNRRIIRRWVRAHVRQHERLGR